MVISRRALAEYLDRDMRSFVWMKRLKRQDLLEALCDVETLPQFKTEPWLHQLVCFYIGLCEPEFLFLLDMGLGKSKILIDLVTQRIRENRISRALITVPNVINMASWEDDVLRHSDLEPLSCSVTSIEGKRELLLHPRAGEVVTIDYQGLVLALCDRVKGKYRPNPKYIAQAQRLYRFIGMDESQKLGNHQNLWFSLMRDLTDTAKFVYATTGTVFGKNPERMWSQFYLVDRGDTFGENLGLFHEAYFGSTDNPFGAPTFTFNKRRTAEVHRRMQNKSIRYEDSEVPEVELPRRMPPIIQKLNMASEQREHFQKALEGLINIQGCGDPVLCEAPYLRCRQIASGYLVWKDESGEHTVFFKDNPKLQAVEQRLLEMQEEDKMVICYDYTETGRMLVDAIRSWGYGVEWLWGGAKDKVGVRQRFIDSPDVRVLVMNSAAGGTGNDGLQKAARWMLFYESPTPPDVRKQVEKRIDRPGQTRRTFFVDLVLRRSLDQGILTSHAEGNDLFNKVVNGHTIQRLID